jgi:plasmid stability protein
VSWRAGRAAAIIGDRKAGDGGAMAQVIIRNLDEAVVERHRARARARGISLEQELRELLTRAARPELGGLIEEMRRIRARTRPPRDGLPAKTAAELIREDRDGR